MSNNNNQPIPLLLTVKEVSQILRIHRPKVYILIKSGSLEGVKVGADWRIRRSSLEAMVGPIPNSYFSSEDDDEDFLENRI